MNKIWIVMQREFMTRITKKSFLLLTVLMPFIMCLIVVVPLWLSSFTNNESKKVIIVDATGEYAQAFKDNDLYHFVQAKKIDRNSLYAEKDAPFAILEIDQNLVDHPEAATLYAKSDLPINFEREINNTLSETIRKEKLLQYNIPGIDTIVAEAETAYTIKAMKLNASGESMISSSSVAVSVGLFFTMLIYMFILTYGAMVMQSVLEEKTGRIVEIIVSSIRPYQLLAGKMLGIIFIGLLQFFIWMVMIGFLMGVIGILFLPGMSEAAVATNIPPSVTNTMVAEIFHSLQGINLLEICILFVVYFVGGYLFYASIFAAIGASVSTQEDTQQFMLPIILLMAFSMYTGIYSMQNPDGPLAFWCSLIPITSPIVMMIRLPYNVPLWQEIVSIVLLYISAGGIVWLSGQIYRVGILLHGKKPTFMQMLRWISYK